MVFHEAVEELTFINQQESLDRGLMLIEFAQLPNCFMGSHGRLLGQTWRAHLGVGRPFPPGYFTGS